MALQLNTFAKRAGILGAIYDRFNGTFQMNIYPSTVAIPTTLTAFPTGQLASYTFPFTSSIPAFTFTNSQIKLSSILNFTPTVTGTANWVMFYYNGTQAAYMATDSVVANGGVGMIVLSTLSLVASTQASLLDVTLNIS